MEGTASRTRIHFQVDGLPLQSHAVQAREGLNQVSRWRIHCAASHDLDSLALLGKQAELAVIGGDGLSRTVRGLITRVDYQDDLPDARQGHFIFELQAGLSRLAQQQRWRLVQQQRTPELITALLNEYQIAVDNRLSMDYPVHSWLLQGGETDLAWLQRLLAEEGIGFYSTSNEHGETVVLFDRPTAVDRAGRRAIAVIRDSGGVQQIGQQQIGVLTTVHAWYKQVPQRVVAHIQRNPTEGHPPVIAVGAPQAAKTLQETLYLGGHPDAAEARRRASLRLEYWQGCRHGVSVSGPVADLAPGQLLDVQGVGTCLVESATLRYGEPDNHLGISAQALLWEAELKPVGQPWRPTVPPRPDLPEVFPAKVESTGVYSELDGLGRRRARLHLDQGASETAHASPPLRQLQPHSGAADENGNPSGWDWALRNGSEVLVSLLNNDFSQPFILGYLPASDQVGPCVSDNRSQYRLLTPAGHHLNLDDHKHAEQITLHTPEGQCVMNLNAEHQSPLVRLACQYGALVLRAGQSQHIRVGASAESIIQGGQRTQVAEHAHYLTEDGSQHWQAANDAEANAAKDLSVAAEKRISLFSELPLAIRSARNASAVAGAHLKVRAGKDFYMQAGHAMTFSGGGKGDITFCQGGGGITIKADGKIRIFGGRISIVNT